MKIKQSTMMLLGVLALGGVGFYMYSKKKALPQLPAGTGSAAAETQAYSSSTGITDPNMLAMMQKFFQQASQTGMSAEEKRLLESQTYSAYITAGTQGVAAILGGIQGLLQPKATSGALS